MIRHCRTGQLVIDPIVHGRTDRPAAAGIGSTGPERPFFRAVEPERSSSHTALARLAYSRRTGSREQGHPLSRRHGRSNAPGYFVGGAT
jgi:hypothetical protein